jgi:cell division protein ZapA (FtsZ GTPase activity inhibitor)
MTDQGKKCFLPSPADKKEQLTGIDKEIADKTLNLNKLVAEIKSREKLLNELNKTVIVTILLF